MPSSSDMPPDRSHLLTEASDPSLHDLDARPTAALLHAMNQLDAQVPAVVARAIPALTPLVDAITHALAQSHRLIYLGAGTSGRLGVLDASECPPTFQTDPAQVVGIIAGGDTALRKSAEGREDDPQGAAEALDEIDLQQGDVVVGIAAGGTTPYVLGGLALAKARRCATALVCCVNLTPRQKQAIAADHYIELPVGPELVTGSSRLKAGTATKLTLNMISTAAMVKLGKTWGSLMVDVRATNDKLRDRAARIITQQTGLARPQAFQALDAAQGHVKLALVMTLRQLDATQAQKLLEQHRGCLRPILGPPR